MSARVAAVVAVIIGIGFYLHPSPLQPTLWEDAFPLPSLEGALAPNSRLKFVEKAEVSNLTGPESFAMDCNGNAYASLGDGRIVILNSSGKLVDTLFFNGAINKHGTFVFADDSVYTDADQKIRWCKSEALAHRLAWSVEDERSCGRPLGLRLRNLKGGVQLFVIDAYKGVFVIELDKKSTPVKIRHLVSPSTPIASVAEGTAALPPKFYNDLDISEDNNIIYFSDSSYKNHRSQNRVEVLDGAPRGRLFLYNVNAKKLELLLCGLHFPNGVQLTAASSTHHPELLVVESTRFRVLKIDVNLLKQIVTNFTSFSCAEHGVLRTILQHSKPPFISPVNVFLDRAPGFMDNIRLVRHSACSGGKRKEGDKRKYLIGVGAKSTKPFSLLWTAYQSNLLREVLGRLIPMREVEKLVPKFGLILEVAEDGTLAGSYQDSSGQLSMVSEAEEHPITGDLWIGSHSNQYVGILRKDA